jgi:hypothetical protein
MKQTRAAVQPDHPGRVMPEEGEISRLTSAIGRSGWCTLRRITMVVAASDYPLLNAFWTMIIFFAWVIWFWMLIVIFGDLFRRTDVSGWGKAGWFVLILFLPYVGVLIYLIAQGKHMAERRQRDVVESKAQFDDYVRQVASSPSAAASTNGSAAEQIRQGKQLLDSGAITSDEYEALKRKTLAA